MQENKGFTLIELIFIITILAVIMLIALPNLAGIQYRMKVRADTTTASLIGKAIRIWYVDYTTDSALHRKLKIKRNENGVKDFSNEPDNKLLNREVWVRYDEITGISEYCDTNYKPISLIDPDTKKPEPYQFYVVRIGAIENGRKISIGITYGETEESYNEIPFSGVVTYDGTCPGVAYVEK